MSEQITVESRIDALRTAIDQAISDMNAAWSAWTDGFGHTVENERLEAAIARLQRASTNDDIARGRDWPLPAPSRAEVTVEALADLWSRMASDMGDVVEERVKPRLVTEVLDRYYTELRDRFALPAPSQSEEQEPASEGSRGMALAEEIERRLHARFEGLDPVAVGVISLDLAALSQPQSSERLRAALEATLDQLVIEHGHSSEEAPRWLSCGRVHEAMDLADAALSDPGPVSGEGPREALTGLVEAIDGYEPPANHDWRCENRTAALGWKPGDPPVIRCECGLDELVAAIANARAALTPKGAGAG